MFARRKILIGLALAALALAFQIKAVYAAIVDGSSHLASFLPTVSETHSSVWAAVFLIAACLGVASLGKQPTMPRSWPQDDD